MRIDRRFVPVGTDPYSLFNYVKHDVKLTHHVTGEVIFEMEGAEVPEHWSTNARNVLVSKYFRRAGVPVETRPGERPVVGVSGDRGLDPICVPDWLLPRVRKSEDTPTRGEQSIKEVVHRIVGHWTYEGFINGYFEADADQLPHPDNMALPLDAVLANVREANAKAYYNEMVYILLNQMGAPNSPQWFNTGLWWAYGIIGPAQGHSYVDLSANTKRIDLDNGTFPGGMSTKGFSSPLNEAIDAVDIAGARAALLNGNCVKQSPNAYQKVQAHACFILDLEDTMLKENGIYDWLEREARIFKFGSGAGVNPSKLRAAGEKLSGGGKSSGLMSWLKIGDVSAGAIKSGGTTRRAAKMVTVDLNHPDILDFIDCKVDAELQVAAMYTGSRKITKHCQKIMDLVRQDGADTLEDRRNSPKVREAMRAAAADGVPHSYIDRAAALAWQGYKDWPGQDLDLEYEGVAYSTVAFQNANNSVRIPSEFYRLVDENGSWSTAWRTTGTIAKSYSARYIEERIAFAAWFCADPGVQFDTIINEWNVTPKDGWINASNPCSEHMRPDSSACNLASERLMRFVRRAGSRVIFDVDAFRHATDLWQITLDITCTMAHLPDKLTAMSVWLHRDTGLGYADLGAVLMSMGLAYDSDEGRAMAAVITALMHGQCHLTSARMAAALGAYPRFWANKEEHLRCVANHIAALGTATVDTCRGLTVKPVGIDHGALERAVGPESASDLINMLGGIWAEAYERGSVTGFRNAEMTVIAPTGTISIVMDCDTTGIEPMLGLRVSKTLAGGGKMTLAPATCVELALGTLKYGAAERAEILQAVAEGGKVEVRPEHRSIFDTSFPNPNDGRSIPWEAHVKMMGAVQSFISGAISKTVNMPYDATVEDVQKAYRMAHDLGVKALAVYRDGCKLSQPLTVPGLSDGDQRDEAEASVIERASQIARQIKQLADEARKLGQVSPITAPARVRLPSVRTPGINVAARIGNGTLYVQTTRYDDGKLGEIWMTYSADQGLFQAMLGQVCKLANIAMQYGVPAQAVLKTMIETNFEPRGMVGDHRFIKTATSVLNLGARLIAYHELGDTSVLNIQPDVNLTREDEAAVAEAMHEGLLAGESGVTLASESCPQCGSHQYVTSGAGCKKCLQCGYAGGCG